MNTSTLRLSLTFFLLLTFLILRSQTPEAVTITPSDASGFQEIKLTFFPEYACVPDDRVGLSGLDSIAMHSSAILVGEQPDWWHHFVPFDGQGYDGTFPYLYPDSDTSYSITFTPSSFYGTGGEVIAGISAVFNDGFGWEHLGKDHGTEDCVDFYIELTNETTSVTFNVNMSHQVFLGKFDPVFGFLDVAGNFNHWGNPGASMTDEADGVIDSIYSVTVDDMVIGQNIEYKFRINKDWGNAELPGFEFNRLYTVMSGENILYHWYDNAQPVLKTLSLNVNMNFQIESGNFDPDTDIVDVAGTFNDWGSGSQLLMSDPEDDGIYSIIIDSIYLGQTIEYKFRLNSDWNRAELWGRQNRVYTMMSDTNIVFNWWDNDNPALIPGPFFSDYYDGPGNNNALVITNKTKDTIDFADYGIIYTSDGSDWSAPVFLDGKIFSEDSYLIIHADFDVSQLESPDLVDMVLPEVTSFDGNDAIALVKVFDSGTRLRFLDQIGFELDNPGTGWNVAGILNATAGNRLSRKASVEHGQLDWALSAGGNLFDSEWNVMPAAVGEDFGSFSSDINLFNHWSIQDSGTNIPYKSIDFRNDGFGIAVGWDGIASQSTDKGKTWMPLDLGSPGNYNDIQFVSGGHVWIVGNGNAILHSSDGIVWENQFYGGANELLSVCFLDSLIGFAAGHFLVLKTIDGGKAWEWIHNEFMDRFTKVFFTDELHGWLISNNHVIRTFDGGESWEWVPFEPDMHFQTVFFFDRLTGWLAGENGRVMHTVDGGKTWIRQIMQMEGMIKELSFVSAKIGWAVGDMAKVFMTRDAGVNWIEQFSGSRENLNDISFVSRNTGWIVGDNGTIISTLDGWTEQETKEGAFYKSVFFTEGGTGWVVGEPGAIMKTMDAGLSWDSMPPIHFVPHEPLMDIFFIDEKMGWIAASGGFIYKTIDGGENWGGVYTETGEWYRSVYFLDKNLGWATAGGSLISNTTDGGSTWNKVIVGAGKEFNDVYFVNSTIGWVVGQEGIILKSIDGGLSWFTQYTPTGAGLESIYFIDELTGIAIGTDGTILRTTDGGEIWSLTESLTHLHLSGIFFIDELTGWVSGQDGLILHTTDGGLTWHILPQATDKWLQDIYFVDPFNGWAVGDEGLILKTSSAGCYDPYVDLPRYHRICEGEEALFEAGDATEVIWSTGSVEPEVVVSEPGFFSVSVSNVCNQKAVDSVYLEVTPLPEFLIQTDGIPILCKGESVELSVDMLDEFNILDYSFSWDSTLSETGIVQVDTSGYSILAVTDAFGCVNTDSIEVQVQYPWDEELGVVTYDLTERRNLVVWKETSDKGTEFYNIYKVLSSENSLLGSVSYYDLTVYLDTTSRPWQQSDRYVITTVDTCGNESFYSASHKTMHLTANLGTSGEVNLIWEHYEGIPIDWYYVFRGTDSTEMTLLDSISYDLTKTQYTDDSPPGYNVYYQIGIKLPETIVLLPEGKKGESGPFIHSYSNLEDNRVASSVQYNSLDDKLFIYPNPTSGILKLSIDESLEGAAEISIYNAFGKLLMKNSFKNHNSEFNLDLSSYPSGLYLVEMEIENKRFLKRVVRE